MPPAPSPVLPLSSGSEEGVSPALPFVDYAPPTLAFCGIALVGEAPGAEEVRHRQPFVGRSGQLLNRALAEAGINRAACWVLNVFRYQPPKNAVSHFFLSQKAAREQGVPLSPHWGRYGSALCRAEFAREVETLLKTLKNIKASAIVALGRTPLWALTGDGAGLLKRRGQWQEGRAGLNAPVMPTFHPSFILRGNYGLTPDWVADLKSASDRV